MTKAPNFHLQDQDGKTHSLADYGGQWLVLYFYPKDDTPGCTTEACAFSDEHEALTQTGARVVGVSTDSIASHKAFADKYHLSFTLLSDPTHATIEAYDSWNKGTVRNTFIISPEGEIVRRYDKVKPATHIPEVMADLKTLMA